MYLFQLVWLCLCLGIKINCHLGIHLQSKGAISQFFMLLSVILQIKFLFLLNYVLLPIPLLQTMYIVKDISS